MMESETVDLKLAFSYICPECQSKQYVDAVLHEFTPDEQADSEDEIGEKPVTGDWVTCPDVVKCGECGCEWSAVNGGEHGA